MTNSPIHHRPTPLAAVAAAGVAAALMAATLTSANAMPARDGSVEHACFITPPSWNEGLDGPLPRC
jgi:hypothetical protein